MIHLIFLEQFLVLLLVPNNPGFKVDVLRRCSPPNILTAPPATGNMKFPLLCGVNTSFAAAIPSSRSMPSRDKRLPRDTWNTSGSQENFFLGNQFSTFDSSQNHYQGINHSATPGAIFFNTTELMQASTRSVSQTITEKCKK